MRITDIELIPLSIRLTGDDIVRWSGGSMEVFTTTLVRVHTDEGMSGLGETYAGLFAPEVVRSIVEYYTPLLIGRDPTQPVSLTRKMVNRTLYWARNGVGVAVLGAIEVALWDIAGKAANLPVWKLLGGAHRERLMAYASGGLDQPLDSLQAEMRSHLKQGFKAVKIRVGHGPACDVPKVLAAREALGDDALLMVDAVQGHHPRAWTSAQALDVITRLEDCRLTWFEEPCRATDYEGYAHVRARTAIPIAGGESSTTIHDFRRFFDASALDIAQPDPTFTGGIGTCREVALLAESHGLRIVPHVWGSGVCLMSNLHMAFSVPNCDMIEIPVQNNPLRDALLVEPLKLEDGEVALPTSPGIGVELGPELTAQHPYIKGAGVLQ